MSKNNIKIFDWKVFFALLLFFFVVLVNPRDFPVRNLPLIYPAFVVYTATIGLQRIIEGFKRTFFLILILFIYWAYFTGLYVVKGNTLTFGRFAYLIEPILIFIATGAATFRPGGTTAAIWALVSAIILSTLGGLWIYFIGEPVATWRSILHSSVGGSLITGEFIRDIDLKEDLAMLVVRNTGLSYYIFLFSYQLAAAIFVVLATLVTLKGKFFGKKRLVLLCSLIVLILGMITNTERATVLSVSSGLLFYFIFKGIRIFNLRRISMFIFSVFLVVFIFNYTSNKLVERYSIYSRSFNEEKIFIRAYMSIPAIATLLYEPFGAGGMSKSYESIAYQVGWLAPYGPKASHNHFANVIMYTGIVGIVLIFLLFKGIFERIKMSKTPLEVIVACLCLTLIIHSLTHNAGFFNYEPTTEIAFGLLWGVTSYKKDKVTRTRLYHGEKT